MTRDDNQDSLAEFEKAVAEMSDQKFILKLYVTGASALSSRAVENIRNFCEEHLQGRYELEIIDIYQHPELLRSEDVLAAPTLVKMLPLPLRKLIGDMSNEEKIFAGLNIQVRENGKNKGEKDEKSDQNGG